MTQLEALKIAYNELSNMMPYDGENDKIFEAAEVIEKMIRAKEKQLYKRQEKLPFVYENKLYFVTPDGKIYEKNSGEVTEPSKDLIELSKIVLESCKKD